MLSEIQEVDTALDVLYSNETVRTRFWEHQEVTKMMNLRFVNMVCFEVRRLRVQLLTSRPNADI